ncbi:MAG: hypothetical protein IPK15_00925 [Verrucomicrobia bacterium]|nr:hypothetical protein [Verrucomicrobiota bacterium]
MRIELQTQWEFHARHGLGHRLNQMLTILIRVGIIPVANFRGLLNSPLSLTGWIVVSPNVDSGMRVSHRLKIMKRSLLNVASLLALSLFTSGSLAASPVRGWLD